MSRSKSINFKKLVETFHAGLFRFAYCLVFDEQTACDLTQHTFFLYANKGTELRDAATLKPWLYTTLYHEYLRQRVAPQVDPQAKPFGAKRRASAVKAESMATLGGNSAASLLESLEEPLRAPVALFYLRELSYPEMVEVLATPLPELLQQVAIGKSRLKTILSPHD